MDRKVALTPGGLTHLFDPQTIAIVGATESFDKVGGRVLISLIENGFTGRIFPINPGRATVQGLPAFRGIEDIPEPADLVVMCVPADAVEFEVDRACRAGARALIVFASGFSEIGAQGAATQARLAQIVRSHGIPMIGPNCLGIINGISGMMASSTVTMKDRKIKSGRLSFASQSGAIATFWMDLLIKSGLGFSKWVSTGNEAVTNISEILEYLVEDPDTDVIGLYLEGLREGKEFRRALARAAALRKPIIVLKSGRSTAGAAAAASHTGALSGEDAVFKALCERYGVCEVESLSEMMDVSKVFLSQTPTAGNRACVISLSGGAGALMTDAVSRHGFEMPQFSRETLSRLQPNFPAYVNVRNPVDLTDRIIIDTHMLANSVEAVFQSGEFDAVFVFMAGRSPGLLKVAGAESARLFPSWKGSYVNVWQATTPEFLDGLRADGVLVFEEIPNAVNAVAKSIATARVWENPPADGNLRFHGVNATHLLTEHASKRYLAERIGLQAPPGILINNGDEFATARPAPLTGPFAVKLQSMALPHKSGHGAIEIGLRDPGAVAASADAMLSMAKSKGLSCEGVLVEQMDVIEQEFLVGIRHDPMLGPFLLLGRGGIATEVDPDVVRAFLPLTAADIVAMFRKLRCRALLDGFRGRPPVPLDALSDVIWKLCELVLATDDIAEIEINPLCVCRGGRVVAIDAAVRLASG